MCSTAHLYKYNGSTTKLGLRVLPLHCVEYQRISHSSSLSYLIHINTHLYTYIYIYLYTFLILCFNFMSFYSQFFFWEQCASIDSKQCFFFFFLSLLLLLLSLSLTKHFAPESVE